MQAKTFLLINGFIVAFLVMRFLSLRNRAQPTSLKFGLSGDESEGPATRWTRPDVSEAAPVPTKARSLNCWFQYNGHMWDAYEVLGLPGGSDRNACHRAYVDMKRSKAGQEDFYNSAWQALEKHFLQS